MSTQANATESSAIKPALACLARVSLWQTPGAARAEQPSIVCAGIHPEYRSTVSTGHAPEHRQKAYLSARSQTPLGKVGSTYGYSLTGGEALPLSLEVPRILVVRNRIQFWTGHRIHNRTCCGYATAGTDRTLPSPLATFSYVCPQSILSNPPSKL